MPETSLDRLILTSLRNEVIDQYSVDQDGSNVIVIADEIYYLSDIDATEFLSGLLRKNGFFSNHEGEHSA